MYLIRAVLKRSCVGFADTGCKRRLWNQPRRLRRLSFQVLTDRLRGIQNINTDIGEGCMPRSLGN